MRVYAILVFICSIVSCSSNFNNEGTRKVEATSKSESIKGQENSKTSVRFDTIEIISFSKLYDDRYKELNDECKSWILTKEDLLVIFDLCEELEGIDIQYLYNTLPCEYEGQVVIDKKEYYYNVNAGSYIVLVDESDNSVYLGCSSDECKKYFIMEGGKLE